MRVFYLCLLVTYMGCAYWLGGSGTPVSTAELERYIDALSSNNEARGRDSSKVTVWMRDLAKSDDGAEFFMVNLIKYRKQALYPSDSQWVNDDDPMAADARYAEGVIKLLLKRGSLPLFISSVRGKFVNDVEEHNWDTVAIVRYRSVRDMLDMMVEMSSTDLASHKWASIEKTHVFPVKREFSLFFLRSALALLFVIVAIIATLIRKRYQRNHHLP